MEYQRRLQDNKGRTLFGVTKSPCDHHIRTLLDPIAPSHCAPVFVEVFERLEQYHLFDSVRGFGEQLLVALDGTNHFSSQAIQCPNCLTRQISTGHTLYDHSAITLVVVCPGRSQVIALPPEDIMPQDGHNKQDCEQVAGKRWLQQHAAAFAPHQVTLLGDDLYSKQPFGALALAQGFNFIVVCKPDSHPKFGHVADLHFTVSHRQPKLIAIDGHVADLHFTPMCAMRLTASEGERHGTHFRAVSPPCHSDQVIQGGKTKAGQQRYKCQNPDGPRYSFQRELLYKGRAPAIKEQIVDMRLNGRGIRDTARVLKMSPSTVMNTLKKKSMCSPRCINRFSTRCNLTRWT